MLIIESPLSSVCVQLTVAVESIGHVSSLVSVGTTQGFAVAIIGVAIRSCRLLLVTDFGCVDAYSPHL